MTEATPLASEQITQEDREAVNQFQRECHFPLPLAVRITMERLFARHRIAALSASPAPSGQGVSGEVAHGMDSAPKDGTMIRLLVDYTDGGGPLDDALVAWTIGFNDLDGTGVNEWKFAGWCWTHDHFSQGSGTPVGWLPWSNPSTGGDAK